MSIIRGLGSRLGSAAMIFLVAVVAIAAAAAGPTYYSAAKTSILRDTAGTGTVVGRSFEVTQSGPVNSTIGSLSARVTAVLANGLGRADATNLGQIFQPQVESIESSAFDPVRQQSIPLVWRTDVCAHLVIRGNCPSRPGQVIMSSSLAMALGFRVGEELSVPTWGTLTITGVYAPPNGGDYWFDTLSNYFPWEFPVGGPASKGPASASVDAFFTVEATLQAAPSTVQGTDRIDDLLAVSRLHSGDVRPLEDSVNELLESDQLQQIQAIPTSEIPNTMRSITSAWSSLAVPVVLISAQLLGLAWLLLLLLVTEAAEARGSEVALAKLRGHGRVRTVGFGLSEPVVLLAFALPVGAFVGWFATVGLAGDLLRPGTPVPFSGLSWAAAAAAAAGGLAAVVIASRRMLGRPVVEQWRRTGRRAADRGWVIDGILLTAAAVGLLDLLATGTVSSAHKNALALLVPGLLGLAVAVVASRLLPVACRALTAGDRVGRGLGAYLALRHVARRPGGARTTIMLAASFALATFAVAAWAVNDHNDSVLANAQVGAPIVLDVAIPQATNLGTLVARADPSGHQAAPVEEFESNGMVTLAVDPARWSKVTTWLGTKPRNLSIVLAPPSPAPIVLDGSAVRVTMTIKSVSPPDSTVILDVDSPDATAMTPIELGTPPGSGRFVATAALVGCPCLLQDLTIQPPPQAFHSSPPATGNLTLNGIEVADSNTRWSPVAGVNEAGRWYAPGTPGQVTARPGGLYWNFSPQGSGSSAVLAPLDRPSPLPAVAASAVTGGKTGPHTITGVDGNDLPVMVTAVVSAVPGAPATGVVVDLDYANLAADGFVSSEASEQVWVAAGAEKTVTARLKKFGVQVLDVTSESGTKALLGRQGPALARVLFLAEAVAAAALAAGAAILGLYMFARRRRYEYAALEVTGLPTRTLLGSLMAEQLIVVAYGLVIGIGAGLAAVAVALRAVPEFLSVPAAPNLSYLPPAGELAGFLAIITSVVLIGAILASVAMIRSIRLDQLREAPV